MVLNDVGDPVSAAAAAAELAATIGSRTLQYNPTVDELLQAKGGANTAATTDALRNHRSGFVEDMAVPGAVFDMQYNDFNSKGVAEAPNRSIFGDVSAGKAPYLRQERAMRHCCRALWHCQSVPVCPDWPEAAACTAGVSV